MQTFVDWYCHHKRKRFQIELRRYINCLFDNQSLWKNVIIYSLVKGNWFQTFGGFVLEWLLFFFSFFYLLGGKYCCLCLWFRVKNFHETQKGIYRGFYLTFLVSTLFNYKDRNNALRPYAIYLIFNCLIEIRWCLFLT